ncbi:hypothetical protein BKA82DRAFT_4103741 [Pisolithus tinctorius]|nr:hypothetical protein BKA82DRAFT_4103741 [Pisolithus tinctorius]
MVMVDVVTFVLFSGNPLHFALFPCNPYLSLSISLPFPFPCPFLLSPNSIFLSFSLPLPLPVFSLPSFALFLCSDTIFISLPLPLHHMP